MSKNKDIDKLNRQINDLLGEEDPTHEVIIDRRYAYDDIGDTKKINKLDDIEDDYDDEYEEEIEVPKKKMTRVERLENTEEKEIKEEQREEIEEDEEDSINYGALIIGGVFFLVVLASMIVFFVYF